MNTKVTLTKRQQLDTKLVAAMTQKLESKSKLRSRLQKHAGDVQGATSELREAAKSKNIAERAEAMLALGAAAQYALRYGGGSLPDVLRESMGEISMSVEAKDAPLRNAALEAIAKFAPAMGLEVVATIIATKRLTAEQTVAAMYTLRCCQPDEVESASTWICAQLDHKSLEVRQEACALLGWLGEVASSSVAKLAEFAGKECDHVVRSSAIAALLSLDPSGQKAAQCKFDSDDARKLIRELQRTGMRGRAWRKELERQLPEVERQRKLSCRQIKFSKNALRNFLFLKWYTDPSADTYSSPAAIRDKWNSEHKGDEISDRESLKQGADTVKKGCKAARELIEKHGLDLDDAIKLAGGDGDKS